MIRQRPIAVASLSSPAPLRLVPWALMLSALVAGGTLPGPVLAQEPRCFHSVELGVNGEDAALARSARLGWMRSTFRWSRIEPAPGAWDFRHTDAVVAAAEAAGVKLLAILSTAPEWAGSNANGTRPPEDLDLWREFVRQVASRYCGKVAAYEIWNEPNFFDHDVGVGWALSHLQAPRYVDYLRAAAEVIRAETPGTLVVGPATSSEADARTELLFAQLEESFAGGAPAGSVLDAVSFHANAIDDEPAAEVEGRANQQLAVLAARHPSSAGKPVWITELGWKTNRVGEGGQRGRVLSLLEAWSGRCDPLVPARVFLFQLSDQPGTETRGLFRVDGTPKLIVPTYFATLPFPAATRDPLDLSIAAVCEGLVCDLEATEWTGNPFSLAVCRWDFGDGTGEEGTSCRARHQYPDARDRVVQLTVEILNVAVHRTDARVLPAAMCNDFDPPRVEITFPSPGTDLTGAHSVLYFFRDNLGFSDAALLVDGRRIVGRPPPPFQLIFDTAAFPTGPHRLQVALTDRCGNRTASAPVEVFIDRRPPVVELVTPEDGAVVSGRLVARAEAHDNRAVERVELYVDRRLRATDREPPYELYWHAAFHPEGPHQITARAFDRAGNRGDATPITIHVEHAPPPPSHGAGPEPAERDGELRPEARLTLKPGRAACGSARRDCS